jgi:hypothetical protein
MAQVGGRAAETTGVGTRRRRPEAEDLLRIGGHRRSMQALRRAAANAASEAAVTAGVRARTAPGSRDGDAEAGADVTILADARARRARDRDGERLSS